MSFRYKSALLSLASLLVIYGWYFATWFARAPGAARGNGIVSLGMTVIVISVVQIVGHIAIVIASREAAPQLDERERAFDRRATHVGYYALIAGLFGVLPWLGGDRGGGALANAIVLLVVIAEALRQATFLLQHHRAA